MTASTPLQTVELPTCCMDCDERARHVQHALAALPGVQQATVLLAAEKALVTVDPGQVSLPALRSAVVQAGYQVGPMAGPESASPPDRSAWAFTRQVLTLFGLVFGAVLLIVVADEWLGLFEALTERVPLPAGAVLVLLAGYPVFRGVVQAAATGE
jgi:Cu+-exporting ATPase